MPAGAVAHHAVTQGIELSCIILFVLEIWLKAYCMSPAVFFKSPWHVIQLLLLVLNFSFVLIQLAYSDRELLDKRQVMVFDYVNPMIRPLFFVAISRSVRRSALLYARHPARCPHVLPPRAFSTILRYTRRPPLWLRSRRESTDDFPHVPKSLETMLILITTANFPGCDATCV